MVMVMMMVIWQGGSVVLTLVNMFAAQVFLDGPSDYDAETASSDAVWSRLTTEERKKFFKIFANPSSPLAQELLTSEEAEREQQAPWWETPYGDDNGRTRFGMKPKMMEIPRDVAKSLPDRPCLVYNISAVG